MTPPAQRRSRSTPAKLHVLISGASGFIGSELVRQLELDGHRVLRLVRRKPKARNEFNWIPAAGFIEPGVIDQVDAVINLAAASTARVPWLRGYQEEIRLSRVQGTRTLAEAMAKAANPPSVFLNASGTNYYGDRPGERLTETTSKGEGFLSDLVEEWEGATDVAPAATRVVTFRTGMVVGRGGAFTPLNLMTKLGLASRMGTGGQHWPWISLHDEAAAIRHLLGSSLRGPVNLVGPTPATSSHITHALAESLHRWHLLAIPEWAIKLGLGTAGRELLLTSQKVAPGRLLADGFRFRHETVEEAIEAMIAR